jgi:hypothetical protein
MGQDREEGEFVESGHKDLPIINHSQVNSIPVE